MKYSNLESRLNAMKHDSATCFCAMLTEDIEHYKSDAFIVYDCIKRMTDGEFAVVFTRKCGCEFVNWESVEPAYLLRAWEEKAVTFYLVHRSTDEAFKRPQVDFIEISNTDAHLIVDMWEGAKFRNHYFKSRLTEEEFDFAEMVDRVGFKFSEDENEWRDNERLFERLSKECERDFYLIVKDAGIDMTNLTDREADAYYRCE